MEGLAKSPSHGTITCVETPPLTAARTTAGPSVAQDLGPIASVPSTGSDSTPSPLFQSRRRHPSPDDPELIAALANYESLSDDALYEAAFKARQAMVKWRNEYRAMKAEIDFLRKSRHNNKAKRETKPGKFEDPEEYDGKHHNDSLHNALPTMPPTTGNDPRNNAKTHTTNPIKTPVSKGSKPRNELHIDMNASMQPVEGKRTRKPRVLDIDNTAIPAPKRPTKRAREPDSPDANPPATDQPAFKKLHTRARSFTPPDSVRTTPNIKLESEEPSVAPTKQKCPVKGEVMVVVKKDERAETKGKNPVRAAAARLMWAKRRADGMNGRKGGRLMDKTVAEVKVKEEEI